MKHIASLLIVFSLQTGHAQSSQVCANLFAQTMPTTSDGRQWEDLKNLKVMSFNLENLFVHVGKFERLGPQSFKQKKGKNNARQFKDPDQIQWIASIIDKSDADIVSVQEVEEGSLDVFAEQFLDGKYKPFLIRGNDQRGIDVGFLIKADLDVEIQYTSNKDVEFTDPATGMTEKIFSRDLPRLVIKSKSTGQVKMVMFANHAKSKRNRPGDPESTEWRTAQYQAMREIVLNTKAEFPGVPVMVAGDFNTDTRFAKEIDPLRDIMESAFDATSDSVPKDQRITHTYHPQKGQSVQSQLDDLFIINGCDQLVLKARIIPYYDASGNEMPVPLSRRDRDKQPSDHRPIYFELDPKKKCA